ncbi:MAG: YceI family protein [Verrucomicrobiota bacterium]
MKHASFLVPALAAFALVACENPADSTTTATVSEAQGDSKESSTAEDPAYAISHSSTVGFVGSKVTGSHEGGFKTVHGHLHISEEGDLTGGSIEIDMTSTWSDNDKLTEHLKNEDFFDVENHPTATFSLTSYADKGDGNYRISGDFMLRGVTKNISFPATAQKDGEDYKVQAEFDINRKDWGIEYAGKADDLIRDEVVIKLDLIISPDAHHSH